MRELVQQIINDIGPGKMSDVAYDTAWLARLGEVDRELSNRAIAWLCEHQLSDGSWGAEKPFYYHDRVISTLAAMIALTRTGRRAHDKLQVERGLLALEKVIEGANEGLPADLNGATVGFEMIVPTLIAEAEQLGIIRQQGETLLGQFGQLRKKKLSLLKGKMINRNITAAFSAEMAGIDGQHMLDTENLQESNGSVGHSPSASAYYALYVNQGDANALSYLRNIADHRGGAPDLIPFDVFEAGWVLWNFSLVNDWDDRMKAMFSPVIDFLRSGWLNGKGIGLSSGYSIPDGDDTSFVYELLARFGQQPDIETVLTFEENDHFRTYHLEANSSNSVNIHALGALRKAEIKIDSHSVQKILNYLKKSQVADTYWLDKWNLTPYYTTAHAVIACAGFADDLIEPSIQWIIDTQNNDGSWGIQSPTAEETAYCIQALRVWQQNDGRISKGVIQKARTWLKDNIDPPYPPLWIGKGLYSPELVVRSAIVSALLLAEAA
ncbi:MAG TPA: prenyltransferase/squalene oxidase repeat-containing protein [Anaerolineales bacterium]